MSLARRSPHCPASPSASLTDLGTEHSRTAQLDHCPSESLEEASLLTKVGDYGVDEVEGMEEEQSS